MSSMAETENKTYNGWSNYPTWAVNLWLSNEESLYREALSRTAGECKEARLDDRVIEGIWTIEQATRFNTADMLKDWIVDDLTPDLGTTFAADLLGYALGEVNWEEIAESWIEMVNES